MRFCPGQQIFSHVETTACLPGMNRYCAEGNLSCSSTSLLEQLFFKIEWAIFKPLGIDNLQVIHQLSPNAHQFSAENTINSAQDFYRAQRPCSSIECKYFGQLYVEVPFIYLPLFVITLVCSMAMLILDLNHNKTRYRLFLF